MKGKEEEKKIMIGKEEKRGEKNDRKGRGRRRRK